MKYLFVLLFPFLLFANLTYESNHNNELAVLESFDIEASFLHDPLMNKMRDNRSNLTKNKHFFRTMDNAYVFIPAIKDLLTKHDIPQDFLYLAMAESNFKTKAYSHKKASGLWQFMPRTAKRYGLEINEYVDERRDVVKSTESASIYLKSLHKRFGKWYLAAIAYNCGGGRLNQAIKEAGSDSLLVLLDSDKKYIPKESRNYIRKIVALALVGNDEQFMLKGESEYLLNRANANSIATISLPRGESLKRLSEIVSMPLEDLKRLNRHLKYDFVPPYSKQYNVYIPYLKLAVFKQNYKKDSMQNIYKVHVVSEGDNLSYIGQKYGVAYRVIKDFNNLKSSRLGLKQKLIIPIDTTKKQNKLETNFYYMVKRGDSLESISRAKKVSIKNIRTYNQINGSLIKIGDRLKLYE